MNSPTEKLAEQIIDRLIAEKIVLAEDRNTLIERLITGKLQSPDWKLAIEKSLDDGGKQ